MKKISIALFFVLFTPLFANANFNVDLSYGDSSPEVTLMQKFLKDEGFFSGDATGNFFERTREAVISFQIANVISPAIGNWGPLTRSIANNILNSRGTVSEEVSNNNQPQSEYDRIANLINSLRQQLSEISGSTLTAQTAGDTTPPSIPTNVTLIPTSGTKVYLSWNPSTDNVGVKGYNFYKYENGVNTQLGYTVDSFASVSASPGVPITLKLKALDTSNNRSEYSVDVTATIPVVNTSQSSSVTFTSDVASVASGQSANLSWSGSNIYACNATAGPSNWLGYKLTSGTFNTGPITSNTTYTLVCTKDTATYTRTVTINVGAVAPSDTTAPSTPTGLSSSSVTTSSFTLSWSASSDAIGVTGYRVYQNGSQIATPTGTSVSVSNLSASTQYSMTVVAVDAAGNASPASSALNVTTSAIVVSDTTAPSVPSQPSASNITQTGVTLSWTASSDAVGVSGYRIYQNGTQIAAPTTNSYTVSNLSAGTTYSFTVSAYDAAGNSSIQSSARSVTTSAVVQTQVITDLYQTVLGRTAQSLSPGQYAKLPDNSSLNNLSIGYSLLYWSDSGVWDPIKKEIAWTGGPGTCCANPATFQRISYSAGSDTWQVNATPWSRGGHAYDGNALDPRTGMNYFALPSGGVKMYNGSSWSDLPTLSQYSSTVQSLAWFPEINNGNGGLFYFNNDWGSLHWWNGQSWQAVPGANPLTGVTGGSFMEYNPVHKVVWVGGRNVSYKIDRNLVVTRLQDSPVSLASGNAFVSVDPVSGKYIVTTSSRTWWEYDILNDVWRQLNSLTDIPITKSSTSHFHVPIPELGVIVYFSHYYGTREVWLYKHNGTIATAPTPTTPTVPVDTTSLSSVIGNLSHDGPATPEQISLILPVTGTLPQSATASVRYKQSGTSNWVQGHPLYRIRPDYSLRPNVGSVPDAFAWPIIDVSPGTTYDIEVTVSNGGSSLVKNLTHTTRSLPPSSGSATKIIPANSTSAYIQTVMNSLNPGDVVEFENGTYTGGFVLNRGGTVDNPIYIKGRSRSGTILSKSTGSIIQIQNASNVIIENLTLRGSGVDSHNSASSRGIEFWSGASMQKRITVRNVTMTGVDVGIKAYREISEFLGYDNTLVGNNTWTAAMIDTNATWNDDGINISGFGNSAFNNTLKGFGDSLALDPQQWATDSVGIHFYRNEIISGGDDGFEADGGHRNISFYDNRLTNTMTMLSLDALFGGPLVAARNISINTGRGPFKFNNKNAGQFIYNNTLIKTDTRSGWGWIQFNNGPQNAWGFRNNILVYQGTGRLFGIESGGHDLIDFTHNSWYPNGGVWWTNSGGSYNDIATAYTRLPTKSPVFSGTNRRHEQDNITVLNPWTSNINLGNDYHNEVTEKYVPTLESGSTPKNSGAVIPNITSGYSGSAPDRGAIISGRSLPTWGDRTGTSIPVSQSPSIPSTPPPTTIPTAPTQTPTTTTPILSSDTTAPSIPTGLSSSSVTASSLTLSWTASSDAVGVIGYRVYQNGTQIATPTTNSYTVTNLSAGSTYSFTVSAYDAAGNSSAQSSSRSVTTLAMQGSQVPVVLVSQPRGVEAFRGDKSIRFVWINPQESEFAGIKIVRKSDSYPISINDGVVVYDGRSVTTFTDSNLVNGNVYYYAIYAYDSRGNYTIPLKLSIDPSSSGNLEVTQTAVVPMNNFPSRFDVRTTLTPSSSGEEVRILQQVLRTSPEIYPEMQVTGVYDSATRKAVERFQIKYGIVTSGTPETTGFGIVGPRTRDAISRIYFSNSVISLVQSQTTLSTPIVTNQTTPTPIYPKRTLSFGDTSDDVYLLQRFLNQKGYTVSYTGLGSVGNESNYYGLATRRAVERFQIANGLNSNGQLDNQTLAKIIGIASAQLGSIPSNQAPTSTPKLVTSQNTSQIFSRVLYKGARGEDVRELQKFLNSNGFIVAQSDLGSPGNETDFYGKATENAVIRFQNAYANEILIPNDLVVGNGRFGISTRKKVLEIMLQNIQRQSQVSTSTATTTQ